MKISTEAVLTCCAALELDFLCAAGVENPNQITETPVWEAVDSDNHKAMMTF